MVENRAWPAVSSRVSDQYFRRGHIENIRALLAECGDMGKIK
jgi:hypothetical protein